jgi:DNA-binding NtrC family response regulator
MKKEFNILITDRNPHVREYLKREMVAEGYRVRLAKTGREVIKWVYHHEPLDLLILDPDLPDTTIVSLFEKLQNRIPALPVVVHTFLTDSVDFATGSIEVVFVEKSGSSVENLKHTVFNILKKNKPQRIQTAQTQKTTTRRTLL